MPDKLYSEGDGAGDLNLARARLLALARAVDLLVAEIRRRKRISNGFKREIEQELVRIKIALKSLTPLGMRSESSAERIERLERDLRHMLEKKHEQRIKAWRDMFEIKREIIKLFPELGDLVMLSDLLQILDRRDEGRYGEKGKKGGEDDEGKG